MNLSFEGIDEELQRKAFGGIGENVFKDIVHDSKQGIFRTFDDDIWEISCRNLFERFEGKKYFFHIGIGGSSLGPEMLISAFPSKKTHFIFNDNVDPDQLMAQIDTIDLKETLFYVVSKSGTTIETVANFIVATNLLKEKGVRESDFKDLFVMATSSPNAPLAAVAKKWNISLLDIPKDVPGRFSVLTPVGLFPALFAGINIRTLTDAAMKMRDTLLDLSPRSNPLLQLSSILFELWQHRGIDQTVLMPYSGRLKKLSFWFVQLWAESLGKSSKGLTPIPACGVTDQHAQLQLFMEGPCNKGHLILRIERFSTDFSLSPLEPLPPFHPDTPLTLAGLFKAELEGTLKAFKKAQRPYVLFTLPDVSEESLGAVILYFQALTATMGHLFQLNPFNQPSVEIGKKYTLDSLSLV